MLEIAYHDDAGDSFLDAIDRMRNYVVRIFPDGDLGPVEEPFDAKLVGIDQDAGWTGALIVQPVGESGDASGEARSVIARRVEVY